MKKTYEKNLVEHLYQDNILDYQTMLEFLSTDDFEQKHFALTFITELEKDSDLEFFIQNLTGEDTKIRELASFRIMDFINENPNLMQILDEHPEILLRTIDDVNPQVCRNMCSVLHLSQNKNHIIENILKKIASLLESTKAIKFKTHKVNKEIFHLYWNFFALENIVTEDFGHLEQLMEILEQSIDYRDYTIRERIAFLSKKLEKLGFERIKPICTLLELDDNFYVKKALSL